MAEEKNLYCIYCGKQVKGSHSCPNLGTGFDENEPKESKKETNASVVETPANSGYRSSVESIEAEFGFCEVCYQLRHVSLLKKTTVNVPFLTPDVQIPSKPTLLICTKCLKNAKED
jgi:hypothetical protein